MGLYRKRPVTVEAQHVTVEDLDEVAEWCHGRTLRLITRDEPSIAIDTLEGTMYAQVGDFIIKGVHGEFYPCKPDIFHATYESVLPRSAAL